jgi:hypothetical protein
MWEWTGTGMDIPAEKTEDRSGYELDKLDDEISIAPVDVKRLYEKLQARNHRY